ncbi:M48 family metalloprotease [Streptomyces sp. NPDC020951]|uniref:M48 family metalloprotease n=1 Tax=Streptomyces sp. NPDC020951 TaxID=3365104 RepID=UPI003795E84A
MSVAPGAATPAADRREVARALVSSPLPLPTTTRLVLLVLVAAAGATFATWWWLVLGRGNWQGAQLACLPAPETAAAAPPDAVLSRFTGCVNDVRLAQSAVVLCGPLALLALALLGRAAQRRLSLWRWAAKKADDDSSLAARLTAVLPDGDGGDDGEGPRPTLWVRGTRRVGVQARASGTVRKPWIVADSHVFNRPDREVEAIFRHELAHLRLRDVSRVRLAAAAWWILLMGVTLPMGAALVLDPGLLGTGLLVRMTVVLVIFLLTLCAVLRVREHDADLGAEADPRAPVGATADHLGSDLPQNRRGRLRRAAGLASHPTSAARLGVLADPARTWGLSAAECLTTGLAAGLLFTDLALLVASLMPTQVQLAYTLTGLLVGWAVAGVATVAWWRAVAVGHRDARGGRPALAGAALGLGVLVGSQLSGRAAGDWLRDTGTADGLTTALSLTHAPRAQVLALATALVIGGALFGVWSTALARAARAAVAGPRSAPACAAAVVLSGLLTAVPLGSWFLFARLTAARATPDIRWSVIDTPWWATGFAVTVCGALTPLAWSATVARVRGRTPGTKAPHDHGPAAGTSARRFPAVAVFVVAGVVVAAGAGWATVGGRFAGVSATSAGRSSGPPATGTVRPGSAAAGGDETVPLDELPVLPPAAERTPKLRADTALVCRALTLGGTVVWSDPERRRDTADLLGGLDDTVLRAASAVLRRDPTGPVDRDALVASVLRCDLYFRYRR